MYCKLNKYNFIFYVIAIIHFLLVFLYTPKFDMSFILSQKIWYFLVKIVSFILIVVFWQFIINSVLLIKKKSKTRIDIIKYTLIYFVVNSILLFLCFPYLNCENSIVYVHEAMGNYILSVHPSFLQALIYVLAYNIIPNIFGVSIVLIFCYSLIFSFFIVNFKEKFKIYHLIYIPFFIPFVLVLNQQPARYIVLSWFLLFMFVYIYLNQYKEKNNLFQIILFAILTVICARLRSEYIFLIVLIPMIFLFFKIFNKKNILIFTIILFGLYNLLQIVDISSQHFNYELHNLSYIYDDYFENNIIDEDIETNTQLLHYVYKTSLENNGIPSNSDSFSGSYKQRKIAVQILMKYAFKRAPYFIKKNYETMLGQQDNLDYFHIISQQQELINSKEQETNHYISESLLKVKEFNKTSATFLLYFNKNIDKDCNNIIAYIYNINLFICLLIIIFLYGILSGKLFYILFSIFWALVIALILLFMKWPVTLYFYPVFQNLIVFLFTIMTEIINKIYFIINSKFLNYKHII